jgi:alpha/beta superfamily hydrolase
MKSPPRFEKPSALSTRATVFSSDGLSLAAEYDPVDHAPACVVMCHAHPRMRGTMKSPLLLALRDELNARGYSVVRFNFRGVDGSDGEIGTGIEEVADVLGTLNFIDDHEPGSVVGLVGWSFGGAVALRTCGRERPRGVRACVAIAPPVSGRPGVTAGLEPPHGGRVKVPTLIVCGDNDKVVSATECRAWAEAAGARYVEVPAANHFFWAKYGVCVGTVVDWLEPHIVGHTREVL